MRTTDISVSANTAVTFSEAVQRGPGTIVIRSGSATGTAVEFFGETSNRISISGSTLTIDPTKNLANDTAYVVAFVAGSIKDPAGNA